MVNMILRKALKKDIDNIMKTEKSSFIPEIQETEELFLKRIEVFNDGFLVFEDNDDFQHFVGYLSSELWRLSTVTTTASAETGATGIAKVEGMPSADQRIGATVTTSVERTSKTAPEAVLDDSNFLVGHDISKRHIPGGDVLYLSSFAILPEYRGGGRGKKLFEMSLKYFESNFMLSKMILLVNPYWTNARKIYEENGFVETRRIENVFCINSTEKTYGIVMEKNINC
jgi:ribosomal-protein-alanine N-acetyltransferase